jgi:hypothetical protein
MRYLPVATQTFELFCAYMHPHWCAEMLHRRDCSDSVEIAREHDARVRGFTPACCGAQRRAGIAAGVTRSDA